MLSQHIRKAIPQELAVWQLLDDKLTMRFAIVLSLAAATSFSSAQSSGDDIFSDLSSLGSNLATYLSSAGSDLSSYFGTLTSEAAGLATDSTGSLASQRSSIASQLSSAGAVVTSAAGSAVPGFSSIVSSALSANSLSIPTATASIPSATFTPTGAATRGFGDAPLVFASLSLLACVFVGAVITQRCLTQTELNVHDQTILQPWSPSRRRRMKVKMACLGLLALTALTIADDSTDEIASAIASIVKDSNSGNLGALQGDIDKLTGASVGLGSNATQIASGNKTDSSQDQSGDPIALPASGDQPATSMAFRTRCVASSLVAVVIASTLCQL
ncbi:uncharacterized protein L969DRAFT_101931 [Mixia osmundae IAM 14324]|uniref:Uncharacterized protein n=1 Tax=Mixia osmundae (strain CBS 9802 / IAM 14324 / JCM 22182 / KY 12970) TaxID=764103 RepID=G7DTY0_MIXOS|nr:uncharacterized protein L969DRAFT_101931 [Mixia osmundae IAM 14324]KEI41754.1 hypothetical protein L969DRAFT_101931 [Mixia osmundae IAM 14324]GAA94040.1 hypothetical protein E5Q_00687 [Mixia osmundae IAM 14324]